MEICRDIGSLRALRASFSGRVALVPTMGYLHEGHLELMRVAATHAEHVITSIFVNPTQFGPGEDFDSYPRELERDAALCAAAGCQAIFAPSDAEMYPGGSLTTVHVDQMNAHLCGARRAGHFDGVTTVVSKLFLIAQPDVAVFGLKDYQQFAILRRMVRDLNFPIDMIGVPTVRERDGLAKSSRNRYLDQAQRESAVALSRGLASAWVAWQGGEREAGALLALARAPIEQAGLRVDYIEAVDPGSLAALTGHIQAGCVLAVAAHAGQARLIDNLRLDGPLPEELGA